MSQITEGAIAAPEDYDLDEDALVFLADLPDVQEKAFGDSYGCVHFFTYALLSLMPDAKAMCQNPARRVSSTAFTPNAKIAYMNDAGEAVRVAIPWARYGRAGSEVVAAFVRFTDRSMWFVPDKQPERGTIDTD